MLILEGRWKQSDSSGWAGIPSQMRCLGFPHTAKPSPSSRENASPLIFCREKELSLFRAVVWGFILHLGVTTLDFSWLESCPPRFTVQEWDVVPEHCLFQMNTSCSGWASSRIYLQVVECSFDRRRLGLGWEDFGVQVLFHGCILLMFCLDEWEAGHEEPNRGNGAVMSCQTVWVRTPQVAEGQGGTWQVKHPKLRLRLFCFCFGKQQ